MSIFNRRSFLSLVPAFILTPIAAMVSNRRIAKKANEDLIGHVSPKAEQILIAAFCDLAERIEWVPSTTRYRRSDGWLKDVDFPTFSAQYEGVYLSVRMVRNRNDLVPELTNRWEWEVTSKDSFPKSIFGQQCNCESEAKRWCIEYARLVLCSQIERGSFLAAIA